MKLLTDPKYVFRKNQKNYWRSKFSFTYKTKELKTKGKNLKDSQEFQKQLDQALKTSNRRPFRNDVALVVTILINQRNAPSIQNIAKNYIDLICRMPISKKRKKSLILKDDLQIKYLSVTYNRNIEEYSSIRFDVVPYYYFLERIHLVKWLNLYNFKHYDDYEEREDELILSEESSEEFNHFVNKSKNEQLNENDEFWKLQSQRKVQEIFLHNNRIKNKSLVDIYFPKTPMQNDLSKPLQDKNDKTNFESFLFKLNLDTFQLDLGKLPSITGEGELYKAEIENQIVEYLKDKDFLKPLMSTIGLTVIVKQGSIQHKDLDNIAREIIKVIVKKINPPTSQWNSLQEEEIKKFKQVNSEMNDKKFKNPYFPKSGFTKYKVIYLPPAKTYENEFVRLNIHDANYFNDFEQYIDRRFNKINEEGEFSR